MRLDRDACERLAQRLWKWRWVLAGVMMAIGGTVRGGLYGTAADYLTFARMLLNGGLYQGRPFLKAESVQDMTRDHLTAEQKAASTFFPGFFETRGWGYGFGISTAPDDVSPVPGRYGWDGGFGTSWINDPGRKLIAIVMTQSSDFLFSGARDAFFRSVYAVTE